MNPVSIARRLAAASLLALGAATVHAQVTPAWVNPPGGVAIALDAAENVYTVSWDYNPAGDIYLAKRNSAGVLQWQTRFDNLDTTRHEVSTGVAADSAGNAIVIGTIRSGYSSPVNAASVVMKFSPAGALLWRVVYDNSFDGSSTVRVLVDGDDMIYVLGIGPGPDGFRTRIRKLAPDGSTVWNWYDPVGVGAPVWFKFTLDGQIVIGGRGTVGSVNGYARIDRQGNTVWTLGGVLSLSRGDIAGDAAGNSYTVDGDSATGGSILRKFSPTGALLWQRAQSPSAQRVEVASDGGPVIAGFPSGGAGTAFMRYDANGNERWRNFDADGSGYSLLLHAQLLLDAADNAYLAAGTLFEMAVNRVNANGSTAWVAAAPGGYASAMALGAGSVYVIGGNGAKFVYGDVPPPTQADLSVTLSDSPDPVRVNGRLTYSAVVHNAGPVTATGVVLTDVLPANVGLVSASATQGSCTTGATVSCSLGSLTIGTSATVTIVVEPRRRGTLSNTVTVASPVADPNGANNSAGTSTTVTRR